MAAKTDLKKLLAGKAEPEFLEWILGTAKELPEFRQRLQFYVATHGSQDQAVQAMHDAIDDLNHYIANHLLPTGGELAKRTTYLKEALAGCLRFGYADAVLPVCEEAMTMLDHMIRIRQVRSVKLPQLHGEFAALHRQAALATTEDRGVFAERLLQLRLNSIGETMRGFPKEYAEALGTVGLARLRTLLEPTFQQLIQPVAQRRSASQGALSPHPPSPSPLHRKILADLAPLLEDSADQLAVLSALKRTPEEIQKFAEDLDARQLPMEALQHLRRHYERQPTALLARLLAERYERLQHYEEALNYRWLIYETKMAVETYDELLKVAVRANQTRQWQERAQTLAREKNSKLLLDLLLREGRTKEALEAARDLGATIPVWEKLADLRVEAEPDLAMQLYFDCAGYSLSEKQIWSDQESRRLLGKAWQLASDGPKLLAFNARLRALLSREDLPQHFRRGLEHDGIPVERLLGKN